MYRTLALFLMAVLATVALAAPTTKQTVKQSLSKRSFTVPRVRKAGYVRNPSQAMGRAYRKFGWTMTNPDGSAWTAVSKTPTNVESSDNLASASDASSTSAPLVFASARVKVASSSAFPNSSAATSTEETDETGEVVATPKDNGAEYLSPVTVGGQKLNLNFDTGSADL